MSIELKIPSVGESISEVQIGAWRKLPGETVAEDEIVAELETDKATFELPAPAAGVLTKILKKAGESASVGEVIAYLGDGSDGNKAAPTKREDAAKLQARDKSREPARDEATKGEAQTKDEGGEPARGEAAQRDEAGPAKPQARETAKQASGSELATREAPRVDRAARQAQAGREEKIVPMSPIRRRIAQRLVEAQQAAALLTTFNEIDMSVVMALRKKYQESFQKAYGVKLGFMSFFVKAVVEALSTIPQVNAEVRGSDIVYRNYFDIGIAVGAGKGLVVPVLRNAERMSFAEIERAIADFARRAAENQLKLEELQGGTFTISNGGIYGSLLSTPIVNPPQSGVLGMHAIQERPVVRDGLIVVRPMMYVALTYDHRVVDGREAVTFLARVREIVEEPSRLLIEI